VLGRASAAAAGVRRGRVLAPLTALAALLALATGNWAAGQGTPAGELTVVMGAPSLGTVTVTPEPEPGGSPHPCIDSQCVYTLPQGKVTLKAEPSTSSVPPCSEPCFLRWSEADCGTNPVCETTLGETGMVAALYRPVRLLVRIARAEGLEPGSVTVTPGPNGPPVSCTHSETDIEFTCPDLVYAEPTEVRFDLTVPPTAVIHWGNDGSFCDPEAPDATTCTAVVNLDPFWVTVGFTEPAPIPFEIKVLLRILASGDGTGTVTGRTIGASKAQIIDCGGDCSESLDYGRRVALDAIPAAGSDFDHWVGVCSTSRHCEFSAGAVTSVRAAFRKAAAPTPPPPPAGPPPPSPRPALAVSARILGISVARTRNGRIVVARIRVNQPTSARAQVERRRRTLARRSFALGAGVRVLRVPLRRAVARGPARFTVLLVGRQGQRMTLRRPFVVPPRAR
jgi:Divergent InlB B-repeat domain